MRCTACGSPLLHKGGENTKDHGCKNMSCPARVEVDYYGNVSVRPEWWFAENYALPFKHNGCWFCVVGPTYPITRVIYPTFEIRGASTSPIPHLTSLQEITMVKRQWGFFSGNVIHEYYESQQDTVYTIPYMALPVNHEFDIEFDVLVSKFDRYLNKLVALK